MKREVILVHGLWFGAWAMANLALRLTKRGHEVRSFDYASTIRHIDDHAAELESFRRASDASQCDFVAHSMGGLVTLRYLELFPRGDTRVVMLGTPLSGSGIVRRISRVPGGRHLFGKAHLPLSHGYAEIPAGLEVGLIAGTQRLGLGVLAGGASGPGDGTVLLSEADAPGLADRIELPVSHTSMLFSGEVADQCDAFLRHGRFNGKIGG